MRPSIATIASMAKRSPARSLQSATPSSPLHSSERTGCGRLPSWPSERPGADH